MAIDQISGAGEIRPRSAWQRREILLQNCATCPKTPFPAVGGGIVTLSLVFFSSGGADALFAAQIGLDPAERPLPPAGHGTSPQSRSPGPPPAATPNRGSLREPAPARAPDHPGTTGGTVDDTQDENSHSPWQPKKQTKKKSLSDHRVGPNILDDVTCP